VRFSWGVRCGEGVRCQGIVGRGSTSGFVWHFREALTNLRGLGAIEVVQSVLDGVRSFQQHAPQTDAVTAMAIRWRG
jgi:hypothetical protein